MALQVGLDRYIHTDPFNKSAWKPPTISDFHAYEEESTRRVSKRTLADAVEALIGAAFLDGRYGKSFECIRMFLPEFTAANPIRSSYCPPMRAYDRKESAHFALLEELIGYKFRNTALLVEAMTHPSYEQDLATGSYGRLAFLGNAVLSMTIVDSLSRDKELLSSNEMHLLRAATMNSGFLAFTCLETHIEKAYEDVQKFSNGRFGKVLRTRNIALWGFMRHGHPEIAKERNRFLEKHKETRQRIRQALASNMTYPWQDLANLEAKSYLSDIVQALFSAVYCDSDGDMQQCTLIAENIKILPTLRQLMQRKVDILHPKSKLGELARHQKVTYEVENEPLGDDYRCIIQVDRKFITEARARTCKEEVVIRAAEQAIKILSGTYAG